MATVKSDSLIQEYPWPEQFKSTLQDLAQRDYGRLVFTRDARSLDPDSMEQSMRGTPDRTMDAVIGSCSYDPGREPAHRQHRLVMVEFKLDMHKNSARREEETQKIAKKADHTRSMLGSDYIVSSDYYVLLSDDVKPVAESHIHRLRVNTPRFKTFIPLTAADFENRFLLDENDYPYIPDKGILSIQKELAVCKTADELAFWFGKWKEKATRQSIIGNLREAHVLKEEIKKAWQTVNVQTIEQTSDDREYFDLELQEIAKLTSHPTTYRLP